MDRDEASAGKFAAEIGAPYPICVSLRCRNFNGQIGELRFDHRDLADLSHVVDQAMKLAKLKLGDDRDEV